MLSARFIYAVFVVHANSYIWKGNLKYPKGAAAGSCVADSSKRNIECELEFSKLILKL